MVILIPQTDATATSWVDLLERYPHFRLVVALSPKFQKLSTDPILKEQFLNAQKVGRLEIALQIPNPPLLPLLVQTDSAKQTLPNAQLPLAPFSYPDDAVQIMARARSDLGRAWGILPKGIVLPYGAASSELLTLVNRLGFTWTAGALGAPASSQPYRLGSLLVWDALPQPPGTPEVWVRDERVEGNPEKTRAILTAWAEAIEKEGFQATLPSDTSLTAQDIPAGVALGGLTWSSRDWSKWIGSPAKNAAWNWLRKVRETLETYKNSGRASIRRLDMAFEELYTAENANFFSDETYLPEFKATLSTLYHLIGQPPPDDLFAEPAPEIASVRVSSSTAGWETLSDGREHVFFNDPAGDDHGNGHLLYPPGFEGTAGTFDLQRLDVMASSDTVEWTVTLASATALSATRYRPLVDIYIDLNGQPNAGTLSFLPERVLTAPPADAWEYCLTFSKNKALLYRTRSTENYEKASSFPVTVDGNRLQTRLPRDWMRGNPHRWGYQVLVMAEGSTGPGGVPLPWVMPPAPGRNVVPVYDLLDPAESSQVQVLTDAEEGKLSEAPFVRVSAGTK